ncbi:hypothetical protein D3C86_1730700 [compost metagenome]
MHITVFAGISSYGIFCADCNWRTTRTKSKHPSAELIPQYEIEIDSLLGKVQHPVAAHIVEVFGIGHVADLDTES